jgi:hypothetical protein
LQASIKAGTASFALGVLPADEVNPDNFATLRNVSGSTVTNYPVYMGRTFIEGEIEDAPQILVNGVAQTTGCAVKTRWGDGSVNHAILSTVVASAANNTDIELTFQNQADDDTALTKSEMLNSRFDFDCVLSVTVGGVTHTASARDMLDADDYIVHCASQVATTIELADHSSGAAYDMTWSSVKLRPVFYATFWNALDKVDIRVDAEQTNSEAMGNLSVSSLSITTGDASPDTVYTKATFTILHGTVFTKRGLWINTAPANNVNLKHNVGYLASTYLLPNYDSSITLDADSITDQYAAWTALSATNEDMYGTGLWNKFMPEVGARPDLGPWPTWSVFWLYSGDYRMRDVSLNNADLAGGWSMNFRECDTAKRLRKSDTIDDGTGFGFPITTAGRMSLSFIADDYNASFIDADDRLNDVGSTSTSWTPDLAHQPEPFSLQDALTGDPHYLKMMQFWASWTALYSRGDPDSIGVSYGRGPTGAEAGIAFFAEIRGFGRALRGRCLAAYLSPDDDPFKAYLEDAIDDALAAWEGRYGVTGGAFESDDRYEWAYDFEDPPRPNALHFVEIDAGKLMGQSPWMVSYWLGEGLGRAVELGYTNAAPLRDWLGAWANGIINDAVNPYMAGDYQMTASASGDPLYQTWQDVYDNSPAENTAKNDFEDAGDNGSGAFGEVAAEHHYVVQMMMAQTYVTHLTNGTTVEAFYNTHCRDLMEDYFPLNPKWAILPRA